MSPVTSAIKTQHKNSFRNFSGGVVADRNVDHAVVESFGQEWERFDQSQVNLDEERDLFERYFSEFPWQ